MRALLFVLLYAALYADDTARFEAIEAKLKALEPRYALTFPGQYRVNFYSIDNDQEPEDRQSAYRARIRQNVDIRFDEKLSSSVRFQLNHTNASTTDAKDASGNGVLIRHAYVDFAPNAAHHWRGGFVPVKEYHHDLLYSAGWGYNPLALEGFSALGGAWSAHYFAAQLQEGDERKGEDDLLHYQLDLRYGEAVTLSSSVLEVPHNGDSGLHVNAALGLSGELTELFTCKAELLYSHSEGKLFDHGEDAQGFAALLELSAHFNDQHHELLLSHASGDKRGAGFLVPLAFAKTNSYWGYTAVLTVMPQSDTGFAADSINISNNGYGLSSIQWRSRFTLDAQSSLQLSGGWFGNTHARGRSAEVGSEVMAMLTHKLHPLLTLDIGATYAQLHDSLSGYAQGVVGTAAFNSDETRVKSGLFGRLQVEF